MSLNNKHLRGAAAASVAAKKARLEAAVSMSRGSTTLIATPPPASLAAAAVLPVSASASGPSPAPPAAVVTLPSLSVNTVMYDPVWSFREKPGESLVLGTVAPRSPIHSSPPAARPSPAQDAAGLGLQGPAVPSSSLYRKAPVQSLAGITTCLCCVKQLKKKGILYICLFFHSHCFCCICNNDFCLSQIKISVLKTSIVKNEFDESMIISK
ncbi:uncharacterized protein BDCG_16159 [Blastomyces dermatitidis ER-3]|uniref:Uncharacterized protein n=1 Tax=Ajellomyces dermatitidis (strain ER-3 / ATCC MYA-2586) TaxID=559297 RepID=A0ABX2VQE5_AJEDR|nr:uncharacterized protein BDCG_16159 [Blastomyces dermatitidis ER-3]OAS99476.1 hypothetical protein BDCG_16159 [Blastomyces dermatitidis ER-3]